MTIVVINLIDFIYGVIFKLLPDMPKEVADVLSNLDSSAEPIFSFLNQVNFVIPLDVISTILIIDLCMHLFFFSLFLIYKGTDIVIELLQIIF